MVLITLIYTFALNSAFAQNADTTPQKTTIDFEVVELKGKMQAPIGSHIKENKPIIFNPLVHIRESFSEEMQHSIENL